MERTKTRSHSANDRRPKPKRIRQAGARKTSKRYASRPSPPFRANAYPAGIKRGNDGRWYVSYPNVLGIHRWRHIHRPKGGRTRKA